MRHCPCTHKQKRGHFHAKTNSAKFYIYILVVSRDLFMYKAHTALDIFRFAVFFLLKTKSSGSHLPTVNGRFITFFLSKPPLNIYCEEWIIFTWIITSLLLRLLPCNLLVTNQSYWRRIIQPHKNNFLCQLEGTNNKIR